MARDLKDRRTDTEPRLSADEPGLRKGSWQEPKPFHLTHRLTALNTFRGPSQDGHIFKKVLSPTKLLAKDQLNNLSRSKRKLCGNNSDEEVYDPTYARIDASST
jgi:hypothetical protein